MHGRIKLVVPEAPGPATAAVGAQRKFAPGGLRLGILDNSKGNADLLLKFIVEGVKALFYAIEKNNLVYAQKVLSMHFDPNLHHDNGYTPLAYAAMKGSQPMVELLLRNGADPMQTTKEGDTPVELALRFSHGEVADLLKRARQGTEQAAAPARSSPAPQAGA